MAFIPHTGSFALLSPRTAFTSVSWAPRHVQAGSWLQLLMYGRSAYGQSELWCTDLGPRSGRAREIHLIRREPPQVGFRHETILLFQPPVSTSSSGCCCQFRLYSASKWRYVPQCRLLSASSQGFTRIRSFPAFIQMKAQRLRRMNPTIPRHRRRSCRLRNEDHSGLRRGGLR
jgi:hypothetical protein